MNPTSTVASTVCYGNSRYESSEYSVIAIFQSRIANAASIGHVGSMVQN